MLQLPGMRCPFVNTKEPVLYSYQVEGQPLHPGKMGHRTAQVLWLYRFFIFQMSAFSPGTLESQFTSELIQIKHPWRWFLIFPSLFKACLSKLFLLVSISLSTKRFHLPYFNSTFPR